jgi:uncharacterized protein YpmS
MGQQAGDDDVLSRGAVTQLAEHDDEREEEDIAEASAATETPTEAEPATVDEAPPTTAPPRAGPVISLRLLLLVTLLNLGLALVLFVVRPPGRVERSTAVPTLPAQVTALAEQVRRGDHGAPYTLDLTDDDLSATAGYYLAQSTDAPFSQVRVTVADGAVQADAVTTGLAVAVPVRVTASVEARDGRPVVHVTDVSLGGLALPAFAHDQVVRQANDAVDLSKYAFPVTVDAVELRAGLLEARGTVK